MPDEDFSVMLDMKEPVNLPGLEIPGHPLMGKPIYREGNTGLADSIEVVLDSGLVHVPPYRLVAGRDFVEKGNEAWSEFHDTNAERITVLDKEGIRGAKDAVYVLDIVNGGLFVWNPSRIKEAVTGDKLVNYALQLSQEEVNSVLSAMTKNDTAALKQLVHGRNVAFAGDYNEFLEASASPDFIQGMDTTYLVIRPANEARQIYSGRKAIGEQRENSDLVIASGGKVALGKMFDKAEGFGWKQFGAWHDGYKNNNTGRVVALDGVDDGVIGGRGLDYDGRPVGVAPEALDAFYKQKDVSPLTVIANEAVRTGTPVQHGDGVLVYLRKVQVKQ